MTERKKLLTFMTKTILIVFAVLIIFLGLFAFIGYILTEEPEWSLKYMYDNTVIEAIKGYFQDRDRGDQTTPAIPIVEKFDEELRIFNNFDIKLVNWTKSQSFTNENLYHANINTIIINLSKEPLVFHKDYLKIEDINGNIYTPVDADNKYILEKRTLQPGIEYDIDFFYEIPDLNRINVKFEVGKYSRYLE